MIIMLFKSFSQEPLEKRSIIKSCKEDGTKCFPVEQFCDGVPDCPLGTDEANSDCSCEELKMKTYDGSTLCIFMQWISHEESELSPVGYKSQNDSAQNANCSSNSSGNFLLTSLIVTGPSIDNQINPSLLQSSTKGKPYLQPNG